MKARVKTVPVTARVTTSWAGHLLGDGEVALAAELERGQLDLERLAMLLPGVELRLPEIEARHDHERRRRR